jgi:hypothetical protein
MLFPRRGEMAPTTSSGPENCRQFLEAFFAEYPNVRLRAESVRVLDALEAKGLSLSGKPGGWAAGIVYALGSIRCGVPGVLNREMEKAFGVSMSTVYKRAAAVRREIWWAWPTRGDAGYGDGLPLYGS